MAVFERVDSWNKPLFGASYSSRYVTLNQLRGIHFLISGMILRRMGNWNRTALLPEKPIIHPRF
jgi:hypothetical protein